MTIATYRKADARLVLGVALARRAFVLRTEPIFVVSALRASIPNAGGAL